MKREITKSNTGVALLLLGIFVMFALGVTLVGSGIYGKVATSSEENFAKTAALSYLSNQIRQHDHANGVVAGTLEGIPAIVLQDEETFGEYLTYLYCYEGFLRELYMAKDLEVNPENGTEILPLAKLNLVQAESGVWHLTVEDEQGQSSQLILALRSNLGKGEIE